MVFLSSLSKCVIHVHKCDTHEKLEYCTWRKSYLLLKNMISAHIRCMFQVIVWIPREGCSSLSVFCLTLTPTSTGSLSVDQTFEECNDVTAMLDCDGLAPVNVSFSSTPQFAVRGDTVNFRVSWDVGTDINFQVDFGDGTSPQTWNWQVCTRSGISS